MTFLTLRSTPDMVAICSGQRRVMSGIVRVLVSESCSLSPRNVCLGLGWMQYWQKPKVPRDDVTLEGAVRLVKQMIPALATLFRATSDRPCYLRKFMQRMFRSVAIRNHFALRVKRGAVYAI